MRFRTTFLILVSVTALALAACGSSNSAESSSAASCALLDGGAQWNNDGAKYDWTCGRDAYEIQCYCDEFSTPHKPYCTCARGGTVTGRFDWTCDRNNSPFSQYPSKCGYPSP
jgi:hypothetical protein